MLKCLGIFPVLGRDFFFLNASKFVFGRAWSLETQMLQLDRFWLPFREQVLILITTVHSECARRERIQGLSLECTTLCVFFFLLLLFCLLVCFGDRELSRSYVRSDMGRRGCRRKICAPAEYKSRQRECVCGREITGSSGSSSSLAAFTPQPQSFQPPAQHFTNHLFMHFT